MSLLPDSCAWTTSGRDASCTDPDSGMRSVYEWPRKMGHTFETTTCRSVAPRAHASGIERTRPLCACLTSNICGGSESAFDQWSVEGSSGKMRAFTSAEARERSSATSSITSSTTNVATAEPTDSPSTSHVYCSPM